MSEEDEEREAARRAPRLALVTEDGKPITRPPLSDIAGQLRAMADDIDAGVYSPSYVFLVQPATEGGWLSVFGWGDVPSDEEAIGTMELAKLVFALHNTTRRI